MLILYTVYDLLNLYRVAYDLSSSDTNNLLRIYRWTIFIAYITQQPVVLVHLEILNVDCGAWRRNGRHNESDKGYCRISGFHIEGLVPD